VVARHDFAIVDLVWIDVPEKKSRLVGTLPLHPELLIEIAIVNFAAPANADSSAAHETVNRCGIKSVDEQLHVFIEFVVVPQVSGEAADGQIGERVEIVEHDAEMREKLALEVGLQLRLRTGQKWADGVVNKMQRQV
jgi:hypothetical protein